MTGFRTISGGWRANRIAFTRPRIRIQLNGTLALRIFPKLPIYLDFGGKPAGVCASVADSVVTQDLERAARLPGIVGNREKTY